MAGRNLTDDDVKALGKEIAAAIRAGGGAATSGSSGGSAPAAQNKAVQTILDKANEALNPLAKFGEGVKGIVGAIEAGMGTFRDLSKSGASFNNDIVGMTVAAAGTRMPLKDFAEVIKNNASEFATLGAGVTRGAEAFAKMSKGFMDSSAADSLRLLGYQNKELNEILALQAVTLRGKFQDDKARDAIAIESATKLATEMDLMAKLTGKSREAQAEQMKKAQMDMQFEAAIRLKTQGMSAEEAAKFEQNARSQLRDAEIRGQGQMFKEVFATGQIMSKEAATQAALNQEQAAATTRQARISADRSLEASDREAKAREAGREAQRAAVADMQNTAKLGLMVLGPAGGVASEALNKSAQEQITYTRSLESVAKANGLDLRNKEDLIKAQQKLEEEAKKAQAGKNQENEQVDGATKALILLKSRTEAVEAALVESLLVPLNNKIGPGLGKFADTYLTGNIGGRRDAEVYREAAARGRGETNVPPKPDAGGLSGAALTVVEGAAKIYQGGLTASEKALAAVNKAGEPKPRSGGTLGMTGNLFEEMGSLIHITKPDETVMTSEQMKNMARGMLDKGAEKALSGIKQLAPTTAAPNIDLGKISQDINTSISSTKQPVVEPKVEIKTPTGPSKVEIINWPKNLETTSTPAAQASAAPIPKPVEPKAAEVKPVEPKAAEVKPVEPKAAEVKPAATQASVRAVDNKIAADMQAELKSAVSFEQFDGLQDIILQANKKIMSSVPFDEFGDLVGAMKAAAERMYLDDEFGDLESAIARASQDVDTEFGDLEGAMLRAAQDVDTEFGDLAGAMKRAAEQMFPDTEFGDLEAAMAKVSQDVDTEFGDLAGAMKTAAEQMYPDEEFGDLEAAIAKVSQDVDTEFGDLAGAMKTAAEQMYPDEEFGDLEAAIAKAKQDISDIGSTAFDLANMEPQGEEDISLDSIEVTKASQDIDDLLSSMFSPLSKAEQAQAAIDDAIKKKQDAQERLNKLWNEGTDEELNEQHEILAEELRLAKENLAKVIDESMGDLTSAFSNFGDDWDDSITQVSDDIEDALPFDDFAGYKDDLENQTALDNFDQSLGQDLTNDKQKQTPSISGRMQEAVEAASPTASGGFNLDSLSFGAGGKPVVKQIKSAAATIPAKDDNKTPDENKPDNKKPDRADKTGPAAESESKEKGTRPAAGGKEASLNDVVTALNSLNTKMGQLINKTEDMFTKQINATKNNSSNIYARS